MVRSALVQMLRAEDGIEMIGEAADGEEGVGMALLLRPDVVLMDVSMPGIGGIEATRHIKSALPDTRVIGLSMHRLDGTEGTMRDAGADIYLTKDRPPEELLAAIKGSTSGTP
jgi:DNA-binding NarL/FixJ family response regulator